MQTSSSQAARSTSRSTQLPRHGQVARHSGASGADRQVPAPERQELREVRQGCRGGAGGPGGDVLLDLERAEPQGLDPLEQPRGHLPQPLRRRLQGGDEGRSVGQGPDRRARPSSTARRGPLRSSSCAGWPASTTATTSCAESVARASRPTAMRITRTTSPRRRSARTARDNATIGTLRNLTAALSKIQRMRQVTGISNIYRTEFGHFATGPRKLSEGRRALYLRQGFAIARKTPHVKEMIQYLLAQPRQGRFTTGVVLRGRRPPALVRGVGGVVPAPPSLGTRSSRPA